MGEAYSNFLEKAGLLAESVCGDVANSIRKEAGKQEDEIIIQADSTQFPQKELSLIEGEKKRKLSFADESGIQKSRIESAIYMQKKMAEMSANNLSLRNLKSIPVFKFLTNQLQGKWKTDGWPILIMASTFPQGLYITVKALVERMNYFGIEYTATRVNQIRHNFKRSQKYIEKGLLIESEKVNWKESEKLKKTVGKGNQLLINTMKKKGFNKSSINALWVTDNGRERVVQIVKSILNGREFKFSDSTKLEKVLMEGVLN